MRVKDSKTNKAYYFEWSTISDDVNSDVVDTDGFVELHFKLTGHRYVNKGCWAKQFALDMIQLSKTNVSTAEYTRKELLDCSDSHGTVKSLVAYCKTNLVKM